MLQTLVLSKTLSHVLCPSASSNRPRLPRRASERTLAHALMIEYEKQLGDRTGHRQRSAARIGSGHRQRSRSFHGPSRRVRGRSLAGGSLRYRARARTSHGPHVLRDTPTQTCRPRSTSIGNGHRQRSATAIGNGHRQRSATAIGNDRQRPSATIGILVLPSARSARAVDVALAIESRVGRLPRRASSAAPPCPCESELPKARDRLSQTRLRTRRKKLFAISSPRSRNDQQRWKRHRYDE